jgi:hypothetical protein
MLFSPEIDTIEEVLRIRQAAKDALATGQTVVEWSSEGNSAKNAWALPVDTVLAETKKFLQAVDPDTYGTSTLIKKGRAIFI